MTSRRTKASWVAIATISILIAIKVAVGLITSSIGILSQAVDSMTDLIAAAVAYLSILKSLEPPDELHSYGHSRFEDLSSMVVGLIIIFAAALIVWEAVQRLIYGVELVAVGLGIITIGASVIINLGVSLYLLRAAREEASLALEADATLLRADIFTNVGVLGGLILIFFTGLGLVDPLMGIALSAVSVYAAARLIRKASRGLLDESIPPEDEKAVREVLAEHAHRFRSFHSLKTRRGGSERYIELHLEMKGEMTVQEAHDVADHLEKEISARLPRTTVSIHLEPEEIAR